jgi:hypothetical protein
MSYRRSPFGVDGIPIDSNTRALVVIPTKSLRNHSFRSDVP